MKSQWVIYGILVTTILIVTVNSSLVCGLVDFNTPQMQGFQNNYVMSAFGVKKYSNETKIEPLRPNSKYYMTFISTGFMFGQTVETYELDEGSVYEMEYYFDSTSSEVAGYFDFIVISVDMITLIDRVYTKPGWRYIRGTVDKKMLNVRIQLLLETTPQTTFMVEYIKISNSKSDDKSCLNSTSTDSTIIIITDSGSISDYTTLAENSIRPSDLTTYDSSTKSFDSITDTPTGSTIDEQTSFGPTTGNSTTISFSSAAGISTVTFEFTQEDISTVPPMEQYSITALDFTTDSPITSNPTRSDTHTIISFYSTTDSSMIISDSTLDDSSTVTTDLTNSSSTSLSAVTMTDNSIIPSNTYSTSTKTLELTDGADSSTISEDFTTESIMIPDSISVESTRDTFSIISSKSTSDTSSSTIPFMTTTRYISTIPDGFASESTIKSDSVSVESTVTSASSGETSTTLFISDGFTTELITPISTILSESTDGSSTILFMPTTSNISTISDELSTLSTITSKSSGETSTTLFTTDGFTTESITHISTILSDSTDGSSTILIVPTTSNISTISDKLSTVATITSESSSETSTTIFISDGFTTESITPILTILSESTDGSSTILFVPTTANISTISDELSTEAIRTSDTANRNSTTNPILTDNYIATDDSSIITSFTTKSEIYSTLSDYTATDNILDSAELSSTVLFDSTTDDSSTVTFNFHYTTSVSMADGTSTIIDDSPTNYKSSTIIFNSSELTTESNMSSSALTAHTHSTDGHVSTDESPVNTVSIPISEENSSDIGTSTDSVDFNTIPIVVKELNSGLTEEEIWMFVAILFIILFCIAITIGSYICIVVFRYTKSLITPNFENQQPPLNEIRINTTDVDKQRMTPPIPRLIVNRTPDDVLWIHNASLSKYDVTKSVNSFAWLRDQRMKDL